MKSSLKETLTTSSNQDLDMKYKNTDLDIVEKLDIRQSILSSLSSKSTKDPEQIKKARIYQFFGVLSFSLSGVFIKIIFEKYSSSFPFFTYLSVRFFFLSLMCHLSMQHYNYNIESLLKFNSKKWMIIRIISFFFSFWLFPLSMKYLKLGLATLITVTSPIFQNILYAFFFNLKINMKYIYACIVCFIGVFTIFTQSQKNTLSEVQGEEAEIVDSDRDNVVLGIFFALSNSIIIALLYISVKKISADMSTYNINYISSFWSGIIGLVFSILFDSSGLKFYFNIVFLFYLVIIALFTFLGLHFINLAIITADISKSSYIMYLQLPIHALFGVLFYNETYNFVELIGIAIILVSSIYTSFFIT